MFIHIQYINNAFINNIYFEVLIDFRYCKCILYISVLLYFLIISNIKRFTSILKNWIITKGSSGVVYIYKLQWNEEYWNESLTFDPDRFLASEDHSKIFLAFSQAERYCISNCIFS